MKKDLTSYQGSNDHFIFFRHNSDLLRLLENGCENFVCAVDYDIFIIRLFDFFNDLSVDEWSRYFLDQLYL